MVKINQIRWQRSVVGGVDDSCLLRNSLHVATPSSCGMLVYSDTTSSITNKVPDGSDGSSRSLLMECVVSRMKDGRRDTHTLRKLSTKREMFSVGVLFKDTVGVPGHVGLLEGCLHPD